MATTSPDTRPFEHPLPTMASSELHVLPWDASSGERRHGGLDPRSAYVETFWLPILGPTATFVMRKLAERLDVSPHGFVVDQSELAASIGIGGAGSRHAPLRRALQRCARYGLLRPAGPATIEVRRALDPMPGHRLTKLPIFLQAMHRDWAAAHPAGTPGQPGWDTRPARLGHPPTRLGYRSAPQTPARLNPSPGSVQPRRSSP